MSGKKPDADASPLFGGKPLDMLLFAMAAVSLVMLLWQNLTHVSTAELIVIRLTDYTVCTIFAGEFFWRWRLANWSRRYITRNWYAVLGMIPVSIRFFHPHPWWRVLLILARLGRAIDRLLGDGFTYRLINRVKDPVVGAISGLITIAMLDRVADVLAKGTYTRNIARALADNQDDLRAMVLEKLRSDPQFGRLSWVPFHKEIAESAVNAVLRVTEDILKDPRADELIADILRENLQQLRSAVAQQEEEKQPGLVTWLLPLRDDNK